MIHEFRLSPPGSGRGVSCDANGAFIDNVSLLKRTIVDGKERWEAREAEELSKAITGSSGLPIDISSKMGGVRAIANALNDGDVARAQIATVLLGIPDLPVVSDSDRDPGDLIKCIHNLHASGLLKADWDPDAHPRWPAGSPESQGGQFAPKDDGETADQTDGNAVAGSLRDKSPDATISARQRFYGDDVPSNIRPDLRGDGAAINSFLDDSRQRSTNDAEDPSYGSHIGDVQVASTGAIALGGPIDFTNPASWKNLLRLPDGAIQLGTGEIITAASLLTAMDAARERAAVNAAFAKFDLDPTNAADVLAIRAYVWAQHNVPELWWYPRVPWSGPQLESVSQSIMALELARPGTLGLVINGDAQSKKYLDAAVELGMQSGAILESQRRPANMPRALQTTSASARAAANLQTNDQMQAHHLIPANVWGAYSTVTILAGQAGWQPDTADNLIPLPANAATQAKLSAGGLTLPIHSTSHPNYDLWTSGEIIMEWDNYGDKLTPVEARAVFEKVEKYMKRLILARNWMPSLY